jgi:AraC family transcriptional regulator, transcriptional activator of pobA
MVLQDQPEQSRYFNAYNIRDRIASGASYPKYIRRDFYKIMLFQGANVFHYGDQSIPIIGDTLLFFSPKVHYSYEALSPETSGYFLVFKEGFFHESPRLRLDEIPLFMPGHKTVFHLDAPALTEAEMLFKKILAELNGEYIYKYDLILAYVTELIHFGMKLEPVEYASPNGNASSRLTAAFLELLDRQFPVELSPHQIPLRTPKDFANRLLVHVNYLNRVIKRETGKTTTEHIFHRLIGEAKAMLKHTTLNVAEIGFTLGFEDPANFNNFFRKQVKMSPSAFRAA